MPVRKRQLGNKASKRPEIMRVIVENYRMTIKDNPGMSVLDRQADDRYSKAAQRMLSDLRSSQKRKRPLTPSDLDDRIDVLDYEIDSYRGLLRDVEGMPDQERQLVKGTLDELVRWRKELGASGSAQNTRTRSDEEE